MLIACLEVVTDNPLTRQFKPNVEQSSEFDILKISDNILTSLIAMNLTPITITMFQ